MEKKLSLARSEERALAVLVDELRASAQAIGNQVGAQVRLCLAYQYRRRGADGVECFTGLDRREGNDRN